MDARVVAFAENVKQRREAGGLSQERLAELAQLHRTTVGLIERLERRPSLDTALKLADALQVENFLELLGVAEEVAPAGGGKAKRPTRG